MCLEATKYITYLGDFCTLAYYFVKEQKQTERREREKVEQKGFSHEWRLHKQRQR
jgi:hypothetical protein